MTDYLDEMREYMDRRSKLALYPALASIAESLHTLASKPLQDVTAPPAPRPAEPDLTLGESSIITLDRIEAQAEMQALTSLAAAEHGVIEAARAWSAAHKDSGTGVDGVIHAGGRLADAVEVLNRAMKTVGGAL